MLRNFVRGLMVVAVIVSARAATAADSDVTAAQIRAALKQLDGGTDRTVESRLRLAKIAITGAQSKANADAKASVELYEAAREVLLSAQKLEPTNSEVADLLKTVQKEIPPPATNPTTNPEAATKPAPETKPAVVPFTVKREVTPAEINRIRQIEWQPDENPPPLVHVDPATRKKFLAANPDIMPGQFNALSQEDQAKAILASGKEEFYPSVRIGRDPASIRDFKLTVEPIIERNCANCHNNHKAGRFDLFAEKNDAAVYSNFLILQRYDAVINGVEQLMVDRTTPDSSLLLQFMLPANLTNVPHPGQNFKSIVKIKNDPRYQAVLKWIKSLAPLAPSYGIDLSSDVPVPVPPAKK